MSHRSESLARIAVLAPVSTVADASAAAQAGARMVDVGSHEALVIAIQESGLDVLICGPGEAADLGRDLTTARRANHDLLCSGLNEAYRAVQSGMAREHIVVQVTAHELAVAVSEGWRTLVDVDADLADRVGVDSLPGIADLPPQSPAEAAARAGAVAAICAWLGASLIRTRQVAQIGRVLDMTESIMGRRPPAWALRGLA